MAQNLAEKNPLGIHIQMQIGGFPGGPVVKNQPANAGTQVLSLCPHTHLLSHAAGQLDSSPHSP